MPLNICSEPLQIPPDLNPSIKACCHCAKIHPFPPHPRLLHRSPHAQVSVLIDVCVKTARLISGSSLHWSARIQAAVSCGRAEEEVEEGAGFVHVARCCIIAGSLSLCLEQGGTPESCGTKQKSHFLRWLLHIWPTETERSMRQRRWRARKSRAKSVNN